MMEPACGYRGSGREGIGGMRAATFYIDYDAAETLQTQLRQRIVDAIVAGSIQPGDRLPSSRKLAQDLGIARNTVTLTYQQLVADGYLAGRERSGVFVSDALLEGVRPGQGRGARAPVARRPWRARAQTLVRVEAEGRPPPSWDLNPYPFLDGSYDTSLAPRSEWRDAVRAALSAAEFNDWGQDAGEVDDRRLIHEIRTKALPRRGVQANADEILITSGVRESMSLICRALVSRSARVVMEEPGFPDLHQLLRLQGAAVTHQPVDGSGIVVDGRLDGADLIFVTPGCHYPTGAHLSMPRRKALLDAAERGESLVVEYDLPASGGFADKAAPALFSMIGSGRVAYLADLCDVLSPALGVGFIVADPELIRDLRKLRTVTGGGVPRSVQRIASFFLSLGHYDALLARQHRVLRERLNALRDALNYYLPQLVAIDPRSNGSAIWVEGPASLSARQLANEAAKRGVLIEASERFYCGEDKPDNKFRMGVTGLGKEKIREGVALLSKVLQGLSSPLIDRLDPDRPTWLTGEALARRLSGSRLLCRTAYGDPYEIDVMPDGTLVGRAGYAHEDCDTGSWWIEGEYWCRRWEGWSYGEVARFLTVVDGEEIRWYRSDLVLFNRGILRSAAELEQRLMSSSAD